MDTALKKWGTISLSEALQPAIKLAGEGYRVGPKLAESTDNGRLKNEIGNPAYEEARKVFRPGGEPLEENELLLQPDLARTFQMIADHGTDVFYKGEIAKAIIETQLATRTDGGIDIDAGVGRMTLRGSGKLQCGDPQTGGGQLPGIYHQGNGAAVVWGVDRASDSEADPSASPSVMNVGGSVSAAPKP